MPTMNRLTRLLALNRGAQREYRIEASADEATVYLYDIIGYDWWSGGGVTAKQFAKDLAAVTAPVLHLRINSPGGDVFEGRAMVAALQAHPAKKIGHIDGLAASAASFIAMHCNELEITDGAFVMIHNGWTLAMGDRHALTETAALLEKVDGAIVDDYAKRTGASAEQLHEWMDAETWFTAAEAVEHGFADRIAEPAGGTQARAWNVAAFDKAPKALTEPAEPATTHQPDPGADSARTHRERELALLDL